MLLLCISWAIQSNSQAILQESFEGTFPPAGWTVFNNGSANNWTQNTTATYSYDGTKSMQLAYNSSNAADAWAFTPPLVLNTNDVTITFYTRVRSASYPESFKLTVGTGNTVADQVTILSDNPGITNTAYQQITATYTPTAAGTYYFAFNCYSDANMWNLYIDSVTISQLLPACTGAPVGGITVSSALGVCPNTPFTLSVNNASGGTSGITYQWQDSTVGSTWNDIAGEVNPSTTISGGISVATYYRRKISCSGFDNYSTPALDTLNSIALCACSPNTGTTLHTSTSPTIDYVEIPGTILANTSSSAPANGYTLYSDTTIIPTLLQGSTYTLNTTFSAASIASVWFDWNQDGTFDPSEWTQITTNASNGSITFTVDPSAVLGNTVMRIRSRLTGNTNGSSSACLSFGSGETEDYVIKIVAGVSCSGPITGGTTILTGSTSICSGSPFTLDVQGATSNVVGLTYQWQSSADGANWSDISGETNTTYNNTVGITDSVYYRRTTTCSGGTSSNSTTLIVSAQGSIKTFPFVEDFESLTTYGAGVLPNCWTTVATGTSFTSAGTPVRNNKTARSGTNYVWAKYSSSAYLISPTLILTAGQSYTFSYYYRPTDPTAGFNIRTLIASASDTSSLSAGQVGTTIYNPGDSSKWTLATYTYTPATTGGYYFAINTIAPIAPWYVMFDDINIAIGSLPVKMTQFKGSKVESKNVLTWTTTKENDNKGFEVQRSFNGIDFNTIGFVASAGENGNSNGNLNYRFTDNQTPAGNIYYRLKQVDINGKETISEIVLIKGDKTNKIEFAAIYPNPAKEKLSLIITSPLTQNLNIILTDVSGRIIKVEKLFANEGNNQMNINVSGLQSGTYLIKATCNNGSEATIQKFVKQ